MDLNYEKIVQAAVTGMIVVYVIELMLKGQKVPQRDLAIPIVTSMVTSYLMGNKSLTLRGDENLQVYVSSLLGAFAYRKL